MLVLVLVFVLFSYLGVCVVLLSCRCRRVFVSVSAGLGVGMGVCEDLKQEESVRTHWVVGVECCRFSRNAMHLPLKYPCPSYHTPVSWFTHQACRPFYSPIFWWSHQPNHYFFSVSSHQNVLYDSVAIADLKCISQLNYTTQFGNLKQKNGDLKLVNWLVTSPNHWWVEWTARLYHETGV